MERDQYDLSKSEAQEIKRAYYATVSFLGAQVEGYKKIERYWP